MDIKKIVNPFYTKMQINRYGC